MRTCPNIWDYPICIPSKRCNLIFGKSLTVTGGAFTWGFFVYLPRPDLGFDQVNRFKEIFSHIGKAYFLVVEGGGISFEHCDSNPHNGIINEFIHIRSDLDRPLFVRDTNTSKKVYIDTKAVYFDDQCYHGGDATAKSTYALRIDGIFTEKFRKIIWQ